MSVTNPPCITYRGYDCHFNEATEAWYCRDLKIEDEKLSKVKAKIDAVVREDRTVRVPAILIDPYSHKRTVVRVVITSLCEPETSYGDKTPLVRSAWTKTADGKRAKHALASLVAIEHEDAVKAQMAKIIEGDQIVTTARKTIEAIPRLTAETLRAAVKEVTPS